jgi:RNA polymerase sigma factor (sigma-70 family)
VETRSDSEVMVAYARGDTQAFAELVRRLGPALRRMMARGVSRAEDVDDLVQQVFLQMHRARRDFDGARPLRPWVFTIAYNLKRGYFRTHRRRPTVELEREPTDPSRGAAEELAAAQAGQRLRAALSELPAAQRDVIELHWFDELSFAEIAEVVGASVSAVKVRAHRGYEALRAQRAVIEGEPR